MSEKKPNPPNRDAKTASNSTDQAEIYERYAPQLLEFANQRLSKKLLKRVEPDDILQSVFRSFFSRYQSDVEELGANELWKLLITITLNKIRRKGRFHSAAKRNWRHDEEAEAIGASFDVTDYREPSASDLVAMCDELAWLNRQLSLDQRRCLELRLQGFDATEIAKELQSTDRTIRRWLQGIRDLLTFRDATYKNAKRSALTNEVRSQLDWPTDCPVTDYREFILEQMIGAGSMCKAYRARRISNQKNVCLRILRQQWRDRPDFQQQFLNEARVLKNISHPAVVPILGMGQMPGGSLFLVMKWIPGCSLAQALRKKSFSNEQLEKFISQIGQSLSEIHDLGVSHGDLHAGNILIDDNEQVWLTDFSFARVDNDKSQLAERIKQDWAFFEQLKT